MQSHAEERALLKAIATGDAKALERLFARAETRVLVRRQAPRRHTSDGTAANTGSMAWVSAEGW